MPIEASKKIFELKLILQGKYYIGSISSSQTILEAIEAMNLRVRYGCRKGICGSCKVKLIESSVNNIHLNFEDEYLLICTSTTNCNIEIEIPIYYKNSMTFLHRL